MSKPLPTQTKRVSTRGFTCSLCGHRMALAPLKEDEVTVTHMPNGKHTYRIRKAARS